MKKQDLSLIKDRLLAERERILNKARDTLQTINEVNADNLNDEVDLATQEEGERVSLKLRDREAKLVSKIDKTLDHLENDSDNFGVCDECGLPIGLKRLLARPVATLCIGCKEEQERVELGYAGNKLG
jgi:RNA polymerase-binding transcription factor